MQYTEIGSIAEKYWVKMKDSFDNLIIDEYVIMPNHIHIILFINYHKDDKLQNTTNYYRRDTLGYYRRDTPRRVSTTTTKNNISMQMHSNTEWHTNKFGGLIKKSVSSIINHYKGKITKYANNNNILFTWQPKFYDRIIRNKKELMYFRKYVKENLLKWENEKNNPENVFM